MRKIFVFILVLLMAVLFPAGNVFSYESFTDNFSEDNGECAINFFSAFQGHELAHGLAAYAGGARPPHRWPIFRGSSWTDDHKNWGKTAVAGFIFNLWITAFTAGDSSGRECASYGGWAEINFYKLGHPGKNDDLGDFWAFQDRDKGGASSRDWRKTAGMILSLSQSLMLGIGERFREDAEWLSR